MNLFELFVKIGVDDKASDKVSKLSNKIGNGLKTAAKIGTAAIGAASAGIAALTKKSIENYAEYEQLVGGVDTLFKNSSKKLQGYAAEAYKTAGMSANDYMANATAFSASLISSLGGDTEKAADYANRAMVSMSDNANKMGTDIDSIVQTYQSLARGNFAMLDNLKLGYGGTKAELERLIADASKYTDVQKEMGVTVDASSTSFDNIVNAIAVVQGKLGVAGATAKEASTTIEGSVNSMKAAWSNLVTGVADDNADFGKLVDEFVESVATVGENVLPRIEKALSGLGKLVAKLGPVILKSVPKLIKEIVPPLVKAGIDALSEVLKLIFGNKTASKAKKFLNKLIDEVIPSLMKALSNIWKAIEPVVNTLLDMFVGLADMVADLLSNEAVVDVLIGIATAIGLITAALKLLNANPIFLMISAVVGVAAALASEEKAIKDVEQALLDLEDARNAAIDAENRYTDAIKGEEQEQKSLEEIQKANGISAEELNQKVHEGSLTYKDMNEKQREVYDAYLDLQEAQARLKESSQELTTAQSEETMAFYENELAIAAQKESFDGYREAVVKAFNEGKVSADQARELIGKAMVMMSDEARVAFVSKIPASIREGLSYEGYGSTLEDIESNFKNVFKNIAYYAKIAWKWVKNLFSGGTLNFGEIANEVAKDGSHANGLDYVPKDGYIAELHKGEAVLTRAEADAYRKGFNGGTVFNGVTIQVNGANIKNEEALAEKIAYKLQRMTERKGAVYA